MRKLIFFMFLAGLALTDCKNDPLSAKTGTIKGKVLDSATLNLLKGVKVTLAPFAQSEYTLEDGAYTFNDLPYGSYWIKFEITGFVTDSVHVDLKLGEWVQDVLLSKGLASPGSSNVTGYIYDFDKNKYPVVKIGVQYWMGANLRSEHYTDGTAISYACPPNSDETLVPVYGRLYQWSSAMKNVTTEKTQGACPNGYHIPSDAEWQQLIDFLGGANNAGGFLKAKGTAFWTAPNATSSDSVGFNAMGTGQAYNGCSYPQLFGTHTMFWTSTAASNGALQRVLNNASASVFRHYNNDVSNQFCVRCIKD